MLDVDTGHHCPFAREQNRHCTAIADRRLLLVDDFALAGSDHDDTAARKPAVAFGDAERFSVQRSGRVELFWRLCGGGHDSGFSLIFYF